MWTIGFAPSLMPYKCLNDVDVAVSELFLVY